MDHGHIISLWRGQRRFAKAVGSKQGTVNRWSVTGRIPVDFWDAVIAASKKLDPPTVITADILLAGLKPTKKRRRTKAASVDRRAVEADSVASTNP